MATTQRATCWSLTINNPSDADEENINLARQKGWTVEGQKEQGDAGTVHYQLMLKTPQTRFSTIKKAFPRAHIEIARNAAALQLYVNKEDTRVGSLSTESEYYPSLSKLWQLMYKWLNEFKNPEMQRYADWDEDKFLRWFDRFICCMIAKGYHVETMAVNPSTRSAVKKYGFSLMCRAQKELGEWDTKPTAQTARQTDTETAYTEDDDDTHTQNASSLCKEDHDN